MLTTPLIERLAARGPVHVVATPANAALLVGHPAVASVIVFDKRGADRGVGGVRRVAAALRQTGATTAYMAQGSLRTAALARLAGIPVRVGFSTSPGRVLYTQRVPFDATLHHAQRLWSLASAPHAAAPHETAPHETAPHGATPKVRPSLFPSVADYAKADALLSSGPSGTRVHNDATSASGPRVRTVVFAPGSVWATKRWPAFDALGVELLQRAAQQWPHDRVRLVIIGAAGDAPLAASIIRAVHAADTATPHGRTMEVIDATGNLSLLGSAALLARADALVTNDSAPLHLASAMNTPTVALFGPTVPAFGFGPLADAQAVVQREGLACRPCHAHGPQQCPLTHWDCMRQVTPTHVADVLARTDLLGSSGRRR
ncbi:MAG: glycosyltransferase family 9 protein [Gemmatimonadaceae bacterium]|nr:glycosyltransferase family 9 protein [Gemmatimonadaceae bacterium]